MNEEEKKAIERIDYIQDFIIENGQYNADVNDMQYFSKVLNVIKKQSKEIEELIQRNKDLEEIEKEHKEENGRLRDKIKKLEEKQIHRYNKECLNCGVNFIAKRIDTDYCKKCSHIVANRKYKQKNKEKVNAYAKIYMRKRRANKVEEDIKE